MPVCDRCGHIAATAEMRRTSKGAVCKDKWTCKIRKGKK